MNWTTEKLDKIPEVYRDFLIVLGRGDDEVYQGGLDFHRQSEGWMSIDQIFNSLRLKHLYSPQQIWILAANLNKAGVVELDEEEGYIRTTERGAELARAIIEATLRQELERVPPFPTI